MAQQETNISHKTELAASKLGFAMHRNNTGVFYAIKDHGFKRNQAFVNLLNKFFRRVQAGLGKGTSDLIGWRTVEITPDMVGKRIAIFAALEIKTDKGRASPEQINFVKQVRAEGGIAEFVKGDEGVEDLVTKYQDSNV